MQPIILIDANVWFKHTLTKLIIELSRKKIFVAKWTEQIQNEWIKNKLEKQTKEKGKPKTKKDFEKIKTAINTDFLDSLVTEYEKLIPKMTNNKKDRHVLAAAIKGNCNIILTYNKKHFKQTSTQEYGINVFTPDEFLIDYTNENHKHFAKFINTLKTQRTYLTNPPLSPKQYLTLLDGNGQGIPLTAKKCKKFLPLI